MNRIKVHLTSKLDRHCDKGFSSKSSLRHHVFIKHLEDEKSSSTLKSENPSETNSKPFKAIANSRHQRSENIEIINLQVGDLSKHVEVQITEAETEEVDVTHQPAGGRGVIVSQGEARARGQEIAQKTNDSSSSSMYYWIWFFWSTVCNISSKSVCILFNRYLMCLWCYYSIIFIVTDDTGIIIQTSNRS